MASYLAVDVGGTSTRAVVVDEAGRCRGYGAAGRGNPTAAGAESAAAAIAHAVTDALAAAEVAGDEVGAGAAAIAGAGPHVESALREALAAAGLHVELSLQPDLLACFCSGSLATEGYALVAGTGAIAARVGDGALVATSDGVGWLLGDAGSGFWIGHRVARAVAAALDGRAPPTTLVAAVLADLGIADDDRRGSQGRALALGTLVSAVYRMVPVELARFARLAFDAARDGDEVAGGIVDEAGRELATTVTTVVAPHVTGPVVLGGSVLARQPTFAAGVIATLRERGVTGPFVTVDDGTVGRRGARPAARRRRGGGGDVRAHPHHPRRAALTGR